ncbi:MAG: hypothetical protein Ct9H90mP13_11540 [Pseudomonadota bacterium]|nr:MAG: hypothetical protein Ct9H90mP13_11540 [Pseudomonadota bacterium]
MNGILGHAGERWAALNAKVPHSDALKVNQEFIRLMDRYKDRMEAWEFGIPTKYWDPAAFLFN